MKFPDAQLEITLKAVKLKEDCIGNQFSVFGKKKTL